MDFGKLGDSLVALILWTAIGGLMLGGILGIGGLYLFKWVAAHLDIIWKG